jgi:hypothetical protein
MHFARRFGGVAALCALVVVAVLYARPVNGFDIQSSSTLVARPGAEISDAYIFPSPTNPADVVAVMDVNPGLPAGSGTTAFFDPSVLYTMKFDNNYASEAVGSRPTENIVLQFSFSVASGGTQQVYFYGPSAPNATGTATTLVSGGVASATGFINQVFASGNVTIFAGVREDPFFFDLAQFFKIVPDRNQGSTASSCLPTIGNNTCPAGFNPPATATDYFANMNVLSIVVEMPMSFLNSGGTGTQVAYWTTTSTQSGS